MLTPHAWAQGSRLQPQTSSLKAFCWKKPVNFIWKEDKFYDFFFIEVTKKDMDISKKVIYVIWQLANGYILLWFLEMRVCITVCMIFHNGRLSISVWYYYTSAHIFELEMFCLGWDFTHVKNNSDIAVARLKYCLQFEVFLDVIWKISEIFSELLHLMY